MPRLIATKSIKSEKQIQKNIENRNSNRLLKSLTKQKKIFLNCRRNWSEKAINYGQPIIFWIASTQHNNTFKRNSFHSNSIQFELKLKFISAQHLNVKSLRNILFNNYCMLAVAEQYLQSLLKIVFPFFSVLYSFDYKM